MTLKQRKECKQAFEAWLSERGVVYKATTSWRGEETYTDELVKALWLGYVKAWVNRTEFFEKVGS